MSVFPHCAAVPLNRPILDYCTPEQQALFGPLPRESLVDTDESPPSSPSPPSQSSFTSSLHCTRPTDVYSDLNVAAVLVTMTHVPLLRAFKRAINFQDGPLFLRSLDVINSILRSIKCPGSPYSLLPLPNPLMEMVDTWIEPGLPKEVLMRIVGETYQRAVGPNVKTLKKYEAFSSTVYGELMPNLSHDILKLTKTHQESLFL